MIGKVKILQLGQTEGRPNIPESFSSLGSEFISLGQEFDYYEALERLGEAVYRPLLAALNDIVFDPSQRVHFEEEPGYRTSLLRFSSAEAVLETAPILFGAARADEYGPLILSVRTTAGGSPFEIEFRWDSTADVPGRLAAVIGYNGTGKTQLLANLAFIAANTGLQLQRSDWTDRGELLVNSIGTFAGVIAVSYSAFDTFEIPDVPATADSPDTTFGYTYIGLREKTRSAAGSAKQGAPLRLKTPTGLIEDFRSGLERALSRDRRDVLDTALDTLLSEPSFVNGGLTRGIFTRAKTAIDEFESLSSGHKIVLSVVVRLIAHLQPRTLVLIDEPESHLHPSLLAAFLSVVGDVVERFDSVVLIATHSAVVLQEIPSRYVRILRRVGTSTEVELLDVESFAENIGYLTRNVFNLDSSATDFQRVFRRLTRTHSQDEIAAMFDHGLSQQGRAVLAALMTTRNDAQT